MAKFDEYLRNLGSQFGGGTLWLVVQNVVRWLGGEEARGNDTSPLGVFQKGKLFAMKSIMSN